MGVSATCATVPSNPTASPLTTSRTTVASAPCSPPAPASGQGPRSTVASRGSKERFTSTATVSATARSPLSAAGRTSPNTSSPELTARKPPSTKWGSERLSPMALR